MIPRVSIRPAFGCSPTMDEEALGPIEPSSGIDSMSRGSAPRGIKHCKQTIASSNNNNFFNI